ncbi:MAG: hypothetical protein HY647_04120 [Acidobacteria bacterium]|nr:hypothetical protein [Acidobacteriota bacterium]
MSELATPPLWKRFLSPWGIVAILLGIFLAGEAYLTWRDREPQEVLESHAPFITPAFDLQFSRKFPYDPHSFVGRGARAGFWQWTPEGLVLTEAGRNHFEVSGEQIISKAVAGRRSVKRIRASHNLNGERRIEFLYEWTEISLPAAVLLTPPPRPGEEYPGEAVLRREDQGWRVKTLRTLDFEKPMAHLQEIAAGVRR